MMEAPQTGIWLGSAREAVRKIMIASISLTVLLFFWLVFAGVDTGRDPGTYLQFKPMLTATPAIITGWLMVFSAFIIGVYLSDSQGAIESDPTGFFDIISLILSRIAMLAVAGIVCVMFFEVVSRYVFNKPTLWANELSLWMAAFVFLFAGLYAMQQRTHIRIYIIYDTFPRWLQKASDVLSVVLIWAFTTALIWGAYNEAVDKITRMETFGTAWDPPIPATVKAAILIIILLVAIQSLSNLIADWNKAPEHHSPADEIDEQDIANIRRTLED